MATIIPLEECKQLNAVCRMLEPEFGFGVVFEWADSKDEINEIIVSLLSCADNDDTDANSTLIYTGKSDYGLANVLLDDFNVTGTESLSVYFTSYDRDQEWICDSSTSTIALSSFPIAEVKQIASVMVTKQGAPMSKAAQEEYLLEAIRSISPIIGKVNKKAIRIKYELPHAAESRYSLDLQLFDNATHQPISINTITNKQHQTVFAVNFEDNKIDNGTTKLYGWFNVHGISRKVTATAKQSEPIGSTRAFSVMINGKQSTVARLQRHAVPCAVGLPSLHYYLLANKDDPIRFILNWKLSLDDLVLLHKVTKQSKQLLLTHISSNLCMLDASKFKKKEISLQFLLHNRNGEYYGELPKFAFVLDVAPQPQPAIVGSIDDNELVDDENDVDDNTNEEDNHIQVPNSASTVALPTCSKGHTMNASSMPNSFQCSVCYGVAKSLQWSCEQCNSTLCNRCATLVVKALNQQYSQDKVVTDPGNHQLKFLSPDNYEQDRFICDVCKIVSPALRWHCETCKYDLCTTCEERNLQHKQHKKKHKRRKQQQTQKPASSNLFVDTSFPANAHSINGGIERLVSKYKHTVWRRASSFAGENAVLFKDGINEADIRQGSLGDCWILCAVAVIASAQPHLLEKLFITKEYDSSTGKFVMQLCKGGKGWQEVVMDDYFPCYSTTKGASFSRTKGGELWVAVLEKAYAKVHGSYGAIISGSPSQALTDLTGIPSDTFGLKSSCKSAAVAFDKLYKLHNEGCILAALVPGNNGDSKKKYGLPGSHCYSILDVKVTSNNDRLVKIRNPWGRFEWKGDWGDESSKWTEPVKKELGFVKANDGTFWMSEDDLFKHFSKISVLYYKTGFETIPHVFQYSKKLRSTVIVITTNSDYDSKHESILSLHQKDHRMYKTDSRPHLLNSFQFVLMRVKPASSALVSSPLTRGPSTQLKLKLLPKAKYVAVVCCSRKDPDAEFHFITHSDCALQTVVNDSKMSMHQVCTKALIKNAKKLGTSASFANNTKAKRFHIEFPEGVFFHVLNHSTNTLEDTIHFTKLHNLSICPIGDSQSACEIKKKSIRFSVEPNSSFNFYLQKQFLAESSSFTFGS